MQTPELPPLAHQPFEEAQSENDLLLHIMRSNVRTRGDFLRKNIEQMLPLIEDGLVTNRDPEHGPGPVLYLTPKGMEKLCHALAGLK